jgi:hypothetical protein
MMFQDAPAQTWNYMVFGFAVILSTMGIFVGSIAMRFRNLGKDIELLEEIEAEQDESAG